MMVNILIVQYIKEYTLKQYRMDKKFGIKSIVKLTKLLIIYGCMEVDIQYKNDFLKTTRTQTTILLVIVNVFFDYMVYLFRI